MGIYRQCTYLLGVSLEDLQLLGAGPGADGQSESVVKLMDDQVEVDRLLPVDVRVSDRQLFGILPKHVHGRLQEYNGPNVAKFCTILMCVCDKFGS